MMDITEDKTNLLADEALEDFSTIQNKLPYRIATTIGTALGKLQNLEKAEHEGRLIKSPCKVGDRVWLLLKGKDEKLYIYPSYLWYVKKVFTCETIYSCVFKCDEIGNSLNFKIDDFGKTIFLTRKEAQEALEGEDNNENGRI